MAREFYATAKTASRWHRAWEAGGAGALRSRGLFRCAGRMTGSWPGGGVAASQPGRVRLGRPALDAGPDPARDRGRVRGGLHRALGVVPARTVRLVMPATRPPGHRTRRRGHRVLQEGDVAGGKSTVAPRGAWVCFLDETGQGLRPPRTRTWARRGARPVIRVPAALGGGRVSVIGMVCYRPGRRARLLAGPASATAAPVNAGALIGPTAATRWSSRATSFPAAGSSWSGTGSTSTARPR